MGFARMDSERAGFDKWEMYRLVRGEDVGLCRVPKTNRLSQRTLNRYLDKYQSVYVKPIASWGGANISQVARNGASIVWTLQGKPPAPSNSDEILHHYDGIPAIVQQTIPALLYRGCPFDIRVHMQRDMDEDFVYAGELARVGGPGIVSNIEISAGTVLPLSSALAEVLPMDSAEFGFLQARLATVGRAICKLLDPYANIEEVGIDLALDESQRLWLIEVNTNDAFGAPSHELFRHLPDQTVYDEMQERASLRSVNTLNLLFDMLTENPDDEN